MCAWFGQSFYQKQIVLFNQVERPSSSLTVQAHCVKTNEKHKISPKPECELNICFCTALSWSTELAKKFCEKYGAQVTFLFRDP